MARKVVVKQGNRSPQSVKEQVEANNKSGPEVPASPVLLKPGVNRYRTSHASYIFQVETNPETRDAKGNKVFAPQVKVALHANKDYETSDPKIIEALESSSDFGLGKAFWRLDQELEQEATQIAESAEETLRKLAEVDPNGAKALAAKLTQLSETKFDLSTPAA